MNLQRLMLISIALILTCTQAIYAKDLNDLYASDYDLFWKDWDRSKEKAVSCTDYSYTAEFLTNAIVTLRNAEVTEANGEVIESLALKKAECLLAALIKLEKEDQRKIIRHFIVAPIFNEPAVIKRALEKYWNLDKYTQIKELYERTAN